ncbi:M14 family metallopeptidase [Muriicola marianensis]|uniref:Peptidase M14 n=1 Tax=Muriicola marianensis TaxID=1324801 RepID=A0ABQ1QV46_9FLAO|nr:M14 family metallopeptidase [Muriicola marianensis]GGD42856.1 peptidase M14 [Muriicola marianensis]
MRKLFMLAILCLSYQLSAQDYFLEKFKPFNKEVPSPEEFLGYGIGERHTRHDLIVAYFKKLAEVSARASFAEYGRTHEGRILSMLTLSTPENLSDLPSLKAKHLAFTDPAQNVSNYEEVPVFINLAYNVHGNEPSSSEAALLAAYTFAASESQEIQKYLSNAVIFIDPTINPDGRDRHTQWANSYQGSPLVADPQDAEHDEYWPGGRTNHYWFDLNRDWLLGINPESRGKLNWYHQWYPNVVTDFHEMGSQSTYFFEPMKANGSLDPIMPRENYIDLNNLFGDYFAKALDSIGSLYFTKEVFDGTYPGYGSSYPDLQGGLGLLFEQASSRGHKQTTPFGEITFPFTIRNQFTSSITTVRAAVENKALLRKYQQDFFKSALTRATASRVKGYTFGEAHDQNRLKAFVDKLLLHRVKVLKNNDGSYFVPTRQPQYRMVQTVFETYTRYRDSVFYDASAWSLANFYNISYTAQNREVSGAPVTSLEDFVKFTPAQRSDYAYLIDWDDYNAPAALHFLQSKGLVLSSSFRPFTSQTKRGNKNFHFGTLLLPVKLQKKNAEEVFAILRETQEKFQVPVYAVESGLNLSGVDLGSRFVRPVEPPKAAMIIGEGVRSYEAGEVWHLLDTRVHMPITKIPIRSLKGADLDKYNTLVMVSGNYSFDDKLFGKIKSWAEKGNTLITIGTASKWAIDKKLVKEDLIEEKKDTTAVVERKPYADAGDNLGKESVGGIIVEAELDLTHPLAFGYQKERIPVYKNNTVWLAPSKNAYATVSKYTQNPVIDGFITDKNRDEFLRKSASLMVSPIGNGRVVMFADNPNFRGSWYGTNRLFLNALFLGNHINVPK